jgi:WD40 repeat protein
MDGSIKLFDLATMKVIDIGRHGAPISSLHYVPGMNAVVSTAYEPTVHVWQTGNSSPVLTVNTE